MFQRLTSLFFSDSSAPEDLEEPKPFVSKEEEEDGWLIIDLPDSYASASSKERRVGEKDSVCASRCRRGSPPPTTSSPHSLSDCVSRSMPSQPDPCLMDESWFVTPPPCFTAEGPDPVSMESNPMEDLLIEHPSMSVYVTSSSIIVERENPEEHIPEGEVPERRLQRHAPHHSTSLATKAAILEKVNQVRRIQRAKQLSEKHKFSQKVMQRQNRTRECRPRRAKHQGSFVYQPCQRQYNY
uniref:tumor protein p53-inducible nuclear protein 2 isoform X1 n=1 Tax=Podarcis muralis TaxID=64176 RepID=UPI00109F7F16|nr:tumor protein p53-inducible nuclear protein 2 isoform X1 [Podarcis muralis]XP_028590735.1 tumor protein p53-inducible nuclear protein 2 isoform X1 [Podarcis muralis]XP_028590736.1 tumor protein p53-inducible nuclear protein 2 isoform X1 [Podarcis muralis]XP_028590737.1 tumor protein p53-inducible nuclear protein 2 isoform X1 [Podarcis muralis]XP_028590738.1 tumor protein p53-inducible nuclear protein 2 isoform X1 [Podarcis muralis]